jgi:hypothetical protein
VLIVFCCRLAWLIRCKVAWLLCCKVAWLLRCKIAWFLLCKVAWMLRCNVAWMLCCKIDTGSLLSIFFGCRLLQCDSSLSRVDVTFHRGRCIVDVSLLVAQRIELLSCFGVRSQVRSRLVSNPISLLDWPIAFQDKRGSPNPTATFHEFHAPPIADKAPVVTLSDMYRTPIFCWLWYLKAWILYE